MKRIALISDGYIRDAQVFIADTDVYEDDPVSDGNYRDIYCNHFIGIFDGADENEIMQKAASYQGVHPDVISLLPFYPLPLDKESDEKTMIEFHHLKEHVGHKTEILTYFDGQHVVIQCADCREDIYCVDNPQKDGKQNE